MQGKMIKKSDNKQTIRHCSTTTTANKTKTTKSESSTRFIEAKSVSVRMNGWNKLKWFMQKWIKNWRHFLFIHFYYHRFEQRVCHSVWVCKQWQIGRCNRVRAVFFPTDIVFVSVLSICSASRQLKTGTSGIYIIYLNSNRISPTRVSMVLN